MYTLYIRYIYIHLCTHALLYKYGHAHTHMYCFHNHLDRVIGQTETIERDLCQILGANNLNSSTMRFDWLGIPI